MVLKALSALRRLELTDQPRGLFAVEISPEWVQAVADFHSDVAHNSRLTCDVLSYEYFRNPVSTGGLYAVVNEAGAILATQGFVAHELRHTYCEQVTYMSERSLCRPEYRRTGLFTSLFSAGLRDICPTGVVSFLWGQTASGNSMLRVGLRPVECFLDCRKQLTVDQQRSLKQFQVVPVDLSRASEFAREVHDASPHDYFMAYTIKKLRWMIVDNPFVRFSIVGAYRGTDLQALAVIRHAPGQVGRIDEILARNEVPLRAVLAVLEIYLATNGFKAARFVLNRLHPLQARLGGILAEENYTIVPAGALWVARGECEPLELAGRCYITGLWAPPFWAPP